MRSIRRDDPPTGFNEPAKLPSGNAERQQWQRANSAWWEQHPMRYDWEKRVDALEGSKDFFAEVDKRFFGNAQDICPGGESLSIA